jgi:uncharacterized damage-inducible protein DinB
MSDTIPLVIVNELFDYHYWARDRQLQACEAITEEQFLREVGGSFPSLRSTFAHMIGVERLWLARWRGDSPPPLPSPDEFPSLAVVTEAWRAVEGEMREFLAGLDEEALARVVTCVDTRGETWSFPLWRMMIHLVNHQSIHRGQVTNLLRQVGAKPVPVDFLKAHTLGFRL